MQKSASIQPRTNPSKFGGKVNSLFIRLLTPARAAAAPPQARRGPHRVHAFPRCPSFGGCPTVEQAGANMAINYSQKYLPDFGDVLLIIIFAIEQPRFHCEPKKLFHRIRFHSTFPSGAKRKGEAHTALPRNSIKVRTRMNYYKNNIELGSA